MEDLATWIARATYYEQPNGSSELDEELARTMERLRGSNGTEKGAEGGT
jgi:hypothetical protein